MLNPIPAENSVQYFSKLQLKLHHFSLLLFPCKKSTTLIPRVQPHHPTALGTEDPASTSLFRVIAQNKSYLAWRTIWRQRMWLHCHCSQISGDGVQNSHLDGTEGSHKLLLQSEDETVHKEANVCHLFLRGTNLSTLYLECDFWLDDDNSTSYIFI